MNNATWEEAYIQAALEVDKSKMTERLLAARQAIRERLQELPHSDEHRLEIKRMEITMKNLNALETESQNW